MGLCVYYESALNVDGIGHNMVDGTFYVLTCLRRFIRSVRMSESITNYARTVER
jgi:hypothetical protein